MTWPLAGLAGLTVLRLVLAASVPLAPDEAYYWVWSRALAFGYLDHPPMVGWWIRVGTSLAGQDALGVRLLAPLSAALGSVLLYDAAERLFPGRRAGLTAAILLNATLALTAGAVIMTPDTPLLLFWTATLWAAARLAAGGVAAWWLVAGACAGLALLSKYTAAFLPLGLCLYILIASPGWFRRKEPWLGLVIAGAAFLPVVVWNAQNDWAGFLRQGGRVADWRPARAVAFLAELVFGQIGLATPGVAVLFGAGVAMAARMTARTRDPAWTLLAALTLPAAAVFLQHAFGDRVQGNWPAILYPAAAVAAAGLTERGWRHLVWPSAWLGFGLAAAVYGHVLTFWPSLGVRDPASRQLAGWSGLAADVAAARSAASAGFVAAEPYGLAAELAWSLPPGTEVIGTGDHWTRTTLARPAGGAASGILIRPERYGEIPNPGQWRGAVRLPDIVRGADGTALERYAVFAVHLNDPDARALPSRDQAQQSP